MTNKGEIMLNHTGVIYPDLVLILVPLRSGLKYKTKSLWVRYSQNNTVSCTSWDNGILSLPYGIWMSWIPGLKHNLIKVTYQGRKQGR